MSRLMSAAVLVVAVVAAGSAFAMSSNVISTFRGQLVISKDELPEGKNDRDTIAKIKAAQVKELVGTPNEDVTYWHFHYTAFLSRTGATKLKLEFMIGDRLAADQRLDDVDAKSSVLSGDISINEDEGLAKGKTYTVQLITEKNAIVAKTSVTMK